MIDQPPRDPVARVALPIGALPTPASHRPRFSRAAKARDRVGLAVFAILFPFKILSASADDRLLSPATPTPHPVLLIKGGTLVTMAADAGPTTRADMLIRDGRIAAIGPDLAIPDDAEIIDAARQLVLPGFVDVHSHLSITQLRGLYQNTPETEFFPLTNRLAAAYSPDDIYIGMLWAALESVNGGITTTVDFFDNVRSRAHADAGLRALQDSPIRARLHYGAESKITRDSTDLEHLREWHRD